MYTTYNDWDELLSDELSLDYFLSLKNYIENEYQNYTIYPPRDEVFTAFRYTSYADTRVVILGQDPYHGYGQAHGLCFSVRDGVRLPPSLKNIYRELNLEYGIEMPKSGELYGWAKQGVLLLNTTLTVREGKPQSHTGRGWEIFTNKIITLINKKSSPTVFILWGANARSKRALITNPRHLILEAPHPSPLSAYQGFFGCNHFTLANEFLKSHGLQPIDWTRTDK